MKKSPTRNRRRSGSGAAKPAEPEATELDPRANGDPQLSSALKSFEALGVELQLRFLAVVLRDEIGRKADEPVPAVEAPEAPAPESQPAAETATDSAAAPATLAPPSTAALAKLQIIESAEFAQYGARNFPLPVKMSDVRHRRAAVRAVRFPTGSLVMTMICSFVLTLGVMLWRRQSDAAESQTPTPLPLERPFATALPPATPPSWPAARPAVVPVRPSASPRQPAAANPAQDERDAANDLPIELSFRRRPVGNEAEHFGRSGWELTGRIHNLSNDALAVEVSIDGEQGPVSAQVFVEPDGDAEFGAQQGLVIHPNDRITLHSAPYSDIVSQVR